MNTWSINIVNSNKSELQLRVTFNFRVRVKIYNCVYNNMSRIKGIFIF